MRAGRSAGGDSASDSAIGLAKGDASLPAHVAIIMDGNGRWAQQRGLPRIEGHRRGVDTVRMVCETSVRLGIETLTLYCLSSENWKRPQEELDFLMELLQRYLVEERQLIMDQGLRVRSIGRRDRLPAGVVAELDKTIELAAGNQGTRLVMAIDYGGRDELIQAFQKLGREIAAGRLTPDEIDEPRVSASLDTAGFSDPDLLIRTGGEMRVSNFLLWQISYTELWVTQRAWPEFSRQDYLAALRDYAGRNRRFGGI
ncbi:MAG: di-trans,poly-cis-decaprenylcistransferase [Planctomycetaceae bacterium]|nr:MAG: di-trans,poly-cis-decaprenylcistransferase [Planctomycetaceae bacterium]